MQLSEDIAGYIAFVASGKYRTSSQAIPRQRFHPGNLSRLIAGDGSVTSVQDWGSRRAQVFPDRLQECMVSLQGT